jgi:uncharacterized membrane protein YczE
VSICINISENSGSRCKPARLACPDSVGPSRSAVALLEDGDPSGITRGTRRRYGSTVLPISVQLRRLPRLLLGLVLFGVGLGLVIAGANGLPGWDVFHQGLSERTPLSIGSALIVVGAVLLIVMVMLKEPIGVGTIANVVVIGLVLDATLWIIGEPENRWIGALLTLSGPLVVALGSGFYLGVRMGSGPRDGLMTALDKRGIALWKARLGVEATVLVVGVFLGGTVGWGTLWFMIIIGPTVQLAVKHLSLPMHHTELEAKATVSG